MVAIKAHFDGKKIVIPAQMKAQEDAFTKVWDNPEDAVYDSL